MTGRASHIFFGKMRKRLSFFKAKNMTEILDSSASQIESREPDQLVGSSVAGNVGSELDPVQHIMFLRSLGYSGERIRDMVGKTPHRLDKPGQTVIL